MKRENLTRAKSLDANIEAAEELIREYQVFKEEAKEDKYVAKWERIILGGEHLIIEPEHLPEQYKVPMIVEACIELQREKIAIWEKELEDL